MLRLMGKVCVAILYGGKSEEHDVSILSAMQILEAIDREKYEPIPILIGRDGKFLFEKLLSGVDVVFPVLHGPYGEDGIMQGFLETLGLPYVGSSVASCAVAMDKELTKKVLHVDGIRTARYLVARSPLTHTFAGVKARLGVPFFLKPVHLGSSIGIAKIEEEEQFLPALKNAFLYDTRVIFEEMIVGRELECSVLGNANPRAALPGEIILPEGSFYDYELKTTRTDEVGYEPIAKLPAAVQLEIQSLALKAFEAIGGEGMARVDFFLCENGLLYVNEINPIPGFTKTSLYPRMWKESGLAFTDLIDALIELALQKSQLRPQNPLRPSEEAPSQDLPADHQ